MSLADAADTVLWLCFAKDEPACLAAADTDADGTLNIQDATEMLGFIYLGTGGIAAPYPACGSEVLSDLTCVRNVGCDESSSPVHGGHRLVVTSDSALPAGGPEALVSDAPGKELRIPFEVSLEAMGGNEGAYAWSFGIRVETDTLVAAVEETTFDGTLASNLEAGGLSRGGFRHATPVEGGAVSEVILSIGEKITLPQGPSRILRGTLRVVVPPAGTEGSLTLRPASLAGPGGLVSLEVSSTGGDRNWTVFDPDAVPLTVRVIPGNFVRGDSNLDTRYDISDPLHILNGLFESGESLPCEDASDSNDDGRIDLSDAIFTLGCLFLGSECPAAPYPACGVDASADDLACEAASPSCG